MGRKRPLRALDRFDILIGVSRADRDNSGEKATDRADRGTRRVEKIPDAVADRPTRRVSEEETRRISKARFSRGQALGRYVILGELGSGGMSVVYAAYDPQLERKVAVKVLADDEMTVRESEGSDPQTRLLREAHALAQLSHPNVLPVYDIGTVEGSVFMAMECVEGGNLAEWLHERPRSWREILCVFIEAGKGLAAAHEAGLIHRDVKLRNILVGTDGSVRVMDFGLVRRSGGAASSSSVTLTTGSDHTGRPGQRTPIDEVTEGGLVLGTPTYMAPEQHLGTMVDTAGDQYSFCVALYRGLYGHAPFAGDSPKKLLEAKLQLRLQPLVSARPVPRRLRHAILRGLQPDPDLRWPSMVALLEALQRDPAKKAVRLTAAAAGLVMALAGGWAYGRVQDDRAAICTGGPALMAEVWNPAVSDRIENAFSASGLPYAAEAWQTANRALDGYAQEWVSVHRTACQATHVRGEQSMDVLDRRMTCLNGRLRELRAATDVFAMADGETVKNATKVVGTLGEISDCSDLERLESTIPPPSHEQSEQVEDMRDRLATISAKWAAGKYPEAHDLVEDLVPEALALGYCPLTAEVQRALGSLQRLLGKHELAVQTLSEASWLAEGCHHDEIVASAQMNISTTLAYDLRRFDEALQWSRHARATLNRLHADTATEAEYFGSLGIVYSGMSEWDKAYQSQQRALELQIRARGPDDPKVGALLVNLGAAAGVLNRTEEAIRYYERAIEILEPQLGSQHPNMAAALLNLGQATADLGQVARARALFERTIDILQAELGPDHFRVGIARTGLANTLSTQGEAEAAQHEYVLAVTAQQKGLGRGHPLLLRTVLVATKELLDLGKPTLAEPFLRQASDLFAEHGHPSVELEAALHLAQARVDAAQGRRQQAEQEFARAFELDEQARDGDGSLRRDLLYFYAEFLSAERRDAEAAALLERALELPEPPGLSGAQARFALAKASLAAGGDRARALSLARRAEQAYAKGDAAFADERRAIRHWIKAVERPR